MRGVVDIGEALGDVADADKGFMGEHLRKGFLEAGETGNAAECKALGLCELISLGKGLEEGSGVPVECTIGGDYLLLLWCDRTEWDHIFLLFVMCEFAELFGFAGFSVQLGESAPSVHLQDVGFLGNVTTSEGTDHGVRGVTELGVRGLIGSAQ